jgi:hypothetical protein
VIVNQATRGNYKSEPGRQEWATVIECISADGVAIPPLIIFKGETLSTTWIPKNLDSTWRFTNNKKGWTSMEHGEEWLRICFEPVTRERANGRTRLLICDGHDSHISPKFVRHCIDNNIVLILLPPHSSHLLQPLDVGVFRPLKAAMTTQLDPLFRTGLHRLEKAEWVNCFVKARPIALTTSNIIGGWRGAGLFPRDINRILDQLPQTKKSTSATIVSDSPSTTPTRPQQPLFLSSSPPDAESLHKNNTLLKEIVVDSMLESPIRKSICRSIGYGEHYQAANTILQRENKELRDLLSARKERQSGKRLILKGKFIVSTEEVYQKLLAAQIATQEKQAKKGKRKGKSSQTAPVDVEEDSEEELPEVDDIVVVGQ